MLKSASAFCSASTINFFCIDSSFFKFLSFVSSNSFFIDSISLSLLVKKSNRLSFVTSSESLLLSNRDRLKLLEKNNEDLSLNVDRLTKSIKEKDEEISDLKKENLNLKSLLQKLKDKFYFVKHFIITKILDHKEKEKYVQLTRDLYEHRGLDEDDYKELINFSKPINSSRDYITKEKDDYER